MQFSYPIDCNLESPITKLTENREYRLYDVLFKDDVLMAHSFYPDIHQKHSDINIAVHL